MTNEIKEILDYLAFLEDIDTQKKVKQVADHITNLQEKLEVSQTNEETYRLEMEDITKCLGLDEDTIFDEVKEKATNLQKENERLKEELQQEKKDFKEANDYCFELKDYKLRIDKAIEYIKAVGVLPKQIDSFVLLNILQGGDKE